MKGLLIGLSYPVVFLAGGFFVHFYLAKVLAEKDRLLAAKDHLVLVVESKYGAMEKQASELLGALKAKL